MKDFFISFNKSDESWTRWINWQLKEAGYTTLLKEWDSNLGSNFVLKMKQSGSEAKHKIIVLSPDFLENFHTNPKYKATLVFDTDKEKGILIPVRVRKCNFNGLLPAKNLIDLVDLSEKAAKNTLLEGINWEINESTNEPRFPGDPGHSVTGHSRPTSAMLPIWNVPYNRNSSFTGREEELSDLKNALDSSRIVALVQDKHKLGGVGKTQVALEYAFRNQTEYDIVWWVYSEEPAAIGAYYASLAKQLDLPEKEATDQQLVIKAVKQWLEQNPKWLLVFDNVKDRTDISEYIPQGQMGHILITSRNGNWQDTAAVRYVTVLKREESIDLLLKRTGNTDRKAAEALADALGDLPLALEMAGAYIKTTNGSYLSYLELFKTSKKELHNQGGLIAGYPDTVITTWNIAYDKIKQLSLSSADILKLCAFLAPDDIPVELLNSSVQYLPGPLNDLAADPMAFNDTVNSLHSFSLIDVTAGTISVHRLIQAVTHNHLNKDDRRKWAKAAVCIVDKAFPFDSNDLKTWSACSRLLPHVLTAADHAEAYEVAFDLTGRLLNQTGLYLKGCAQFDHAKGIYERALQIGEAAYGPNHPIVAIRVSNLGLVLRSLGDMEGAKKMFIRALRIIEATYGPDHPQVAVYISNLGGVLKAQGDMEGAKKMFMRVLKIDKAAYGPDHPQVAICFSNLASVLKSQGDMEGAKKMFMQALKIDEAAHGPDHPDVAIDLNNLGYVLQSLDDLAEAKKLFTRVLKIDETTYGLHHPQVATDASNLGSVLQSLGDMEGAKNMFTRVLKIDEATLGPDHPDVATDVYNLGSVLQKLDDMEGAKEMFTRAIKISESAYGPDHPKVAMVANNLGSVFKALGDMDGAKEIFSRGLTIDEATLGPDHPDVAIDLNNLGGILKALGDTEEAKNMYKRALGIFTKQLGVGHPNTVIVRKNLDSLR